MKFTEDDYLALHSIVFSGSYPGYRPDVKELPNGDGKVDGDKRYAHIAEKYLAVFDDAACARFLSGFLDRSHEESLRVARELGVPAAFMPRREYGALRVLEYPAEAGGHRHTDFDLFTMLMYRSPRTHLRLVGEYGRRAALDAVHDGLHIGEIGEIIGLGPATPHEVVPSVEPQYSIVYFAIPDHAALLPSGVAVGDWIAERMSRSRTY